MSDEQVNPEKFYQMQVLEEQIKMTQQMLENASEQLSMLKGTIISLNEFSKLSGKEEFLFPLANGILGTGKLEGKKLLVNVGAGVVKQKSIEETVISLQEQEQEVTQFIKNLEQQYTELINNIEEFKDIRQ